MVIKTKLIGDALPVVKNKTSRSAIYSVL